MEEHRKGRTPYFPICLYCADAITYLPKMPFPSFELSQSRQKVGKRDRNQKNWTRNLSKGKSSTSSQDHCKGWLGSGCLLTQIFPLHIPDYWLQCSREVWWSPWKRWMSVPSATKWICHSTGYSPAWNSDSRGEKEIFIVITCFYTW